MRNLEVLILAGGKSERFGTNKSVFKLNGKALISIMIIEIAKLKYIDKIWLSIHDENQVREIQEALCEDIYSIEILKNTWRVEAPYNYGRKKIPIQVVVDHVDHANKGTRAAIIGISSVFKLAGESILQLLPCDTPKFDSSVMRGYHNWVENLQDRWDVIIPRWENGFIEPLHGIFHAARFVDIIESNIQKGLCKISNLFDKGIHVTYYAIEQNLKGVDADLGMFCNLNRLEKISTLK